MQSQNLENECTFENGKSSTEILENSFSASEEACSNEQNFRCQILVSSSIRTCVRT